MLPLDTSCARRALPALLLAALALALPASPAAAAPKRYYVSLGDSYAAGFQATALGQGRYTRNGFPYQVPRLARRRGHDLRLVNFGCGGETTASLLRRTAPCSGRAPGGPRYDGRTQIAAAERFLRRHRGRVALVTVSIGGNDVTACARGVPDPIRCVADAVAAIKANVSEAAGRLREAGGRRVRIVGTTYPDVILGLYTAGASGQPADQALAQLSVPAFKELINPALEEAYASARGRFVDVTAATGAYGPLTETTTLAPYGVLPVPVATVCRISYFCAFRDIHLRTSGYRVIAQLIARTLPRRERS